MADCVLQRVAALHFRAFGMGYDDFLSCLRAGKHSGLVEGFLRASAARQAADDAAKAALRDIAKAYCFIWSEGSVAMAGPYCRHLAGALARIGGYWDGEGGLNRKCFIVPAATPSSILSAFEAAGRASAAAAAILGDAQAVMRARGLRFASSH